MPLQPVGNSGDSSFRTQMPWFVSVVRGDFALKFSRNQLIGLILQVIVQFRNVKVLIFLCLLTIALLDNQRVRQNSESDYFRIGNALVHPNHCNRRNQDRAQTEETPVIEVATSKRKCNWHENQDDY